MLDSSGMKSNLTQEQIDRMLAIQPPASSKKQQQAWYLEAKRKPCTDCGRRGEGGDMHFDHVPSRGPKRFNISSKAYQPFNSEIAEELEKCDLICMTCHGRRTSERRTGKSPAQRWNEQRYEPPTPM